MLCSAAPWVWGIAPDESLLAGALRARRTVRRGMLRRRKSPSARTTAAPFSSSPTRPRRSTSRTSCATSTWATTRAPCSTACSRTCSSKAAALDRELRVALDVAARPERVEQRPAHTRGTVASRAHRRPDSAQVAVLRESRGQHAAARRLAEPGYTVFAHVTEGIEVVRGDRPTADGRGRAVSAPNVPTPLVAIEVDRARLDAGGHWPHCRPTAARPPLKETDRRRRRRRQARSTRSTRSACTALCGAADPEIALTEARMALARRGSPPRDVRARRAHGDHRS